jgi:hypothetical protein
VARRHRQPWARAGLGILSLALTGILVFGVLSPPESCPAVSAGDLRASAGETVRWFIRNQLPNGTWLYLYDAGSDEAAADYNMARHAGVSMGLYQAAAAGIPGARETADRGVEWAFDRLVERDQWAALPSHGYLTSGSTALLLAGLVERRLDTGDERYDERMAQLGRFLLAQTEPSGAVLAEYDLRAERPVAGGYSKYYTGESYWALARMHRLFPDGPWGEAADRIGAYLATRRDSAEDLWPPVPDHWAAYGLAETVAFDDRDGDRPLTDDELAYARRQAGLFGAQVRWVGQHFGARPGPTRAWPTSGNRWPNGPCAWPGWPSTSSPPEPRRPRLARPTGCAAHGSTAARPGWTTSSTPWPPCSARSPSSRPATRRPEPRGRPPPRGGCGWRPWSPPSTLAGWRSACPGRAGPRGTWWRSPPSAGSQERWSCSRSPSSAARCWTSWT